MPEHNTIELVFGNAEDFSKIVAFLDDCHIKYNTNSISVERYSAEAGPSTYEILSIAIPTVATLLAPLLQEYIKSNAGNWFALKESPTDRFVNSNQVTNFLADLEKGSFSKIKFETPESSANLVKVTLYELDENDMSVIQRAMKEIGGEIVSFKKIDGLPGAEVVIKGVDVDSVNNHLLNHQHFWPR